MVDIPRLHGRTPLQNYLCLKVFHNDSDYGNSVFNTTYNFNGGMFGGSFGSGFLNGMGMGLGAGLMNLFGFGGGCGWGGWGNLGNFGCFGGGMPFFGGGMPFFGGGMNFGFPSISNWWNNTTNNNNTKTNSSTNSQSTPKSTTETTPAPASTSTTSTTSTSTSTQTPITPTTETSTDKATTQETTDTKGKAEEKSYGYTGKTVDQLVAALDDHNIDDLEEGAQSEFKQAFHADLDKMEKDNNQGNIENYVNILNQIIDTPNIEKKLGSILKLAAENTCAVLKDKIDGQGAEDVNKLTNPEEIRNLTPEQLDGIKDRKVADKYLGLLNAKTPDGKAVKGSCEYNILYLAKVAELEVKCAKNTQFMGKANKSATIDGKISEISKPKNGKFTFKIKAKSGATYTMEANPTDDKEGPYIELQAIKGTVTIKNSDNKDITLNKINLKVRYHKDKDENETHMTRNDSKAAVGI